MFYCQTKIKTEQSKKEEVYIFKVMYVLIFK